MKLKIDRLSVLKPKIATSFLKQLSRKLPRRWNNVIRNKSCRCVRVCHFDACRNDGCFLTVAKCFQKVTLKWKGIKPTLKKLQIQLTAQRAFYDSLNSAKRDSGGFKSLQLLLGFCAYKTTALIWSWSHDLNRDMFFTKRNKWLKDVPCLHH